METTRKDYAIVNVRGFEEARVMYSELAEEIAERYNRDPALAKNAPFCVCEVEPCQR